MTSLLFRAGCRGRIDALRKRERVRAIHCGDPARADPDLREHRRPRPGAGQHESLRYGQYLDWGMWQAVSESLFYLNLETGKLDPWLAESGEYSEDGTSVTVKLRDGVKWADGVDFTADDVVFTIEMLKANPNLLYSGEMNLWVKSVNAADPHTVADRAQQAQSALHGRLFRGAHLGDGADRAEAHLGERRSEHLHQLRPRARPAARHGALQAGALDRDGDGLRPAAEMVGGGDRLRRHARAGARDLDRRSDRGRARGEGRRTTSSTRCGSCRAAPSRSRSERNPNIIGWTKELPYAYLDACPRDLRFNIWLPPLDNKVIRHAINDAIDRQQLIDVAFEGMTEPSYSLFPTYAPLAAFLDAQRGNAAAGAFQSGRDRAGAGGRRATRRTPTGSGPTRSGNTIKLEMAIRSGETDQLKMGAGAHRAAARAPASTPPSRAVESAVYFTDVATGKVAVWLGGECGSVQDPVFLVLPLPQQRLARRSARPPRRTMCAS